jgi:hypothetical protein
MKALDKLTLVLLALMIAAPVVMYTVFDFPFLFCWGLTVVAGWNFYRCYKETSL